jgi:hypothetical protein
MNEIPPKVFETSPAPPSLESLRRPTDTKCMTTRGQMWLTVAFAVFLLAPSLYGFAGKFIEFIHIFRGNVDGVFAITPITNYLFASLGFFCMMFWALGQGMFADIERPKQQMLDVEAMLDRNQLPCPNSKETTP